MQPFTHLEPLARDVPPTKRGHERCLALLLSANSLFLERGYDAVSLDDIVQHAGGSKASIYKYFGNKEGLFTAICDYRREQFFKDICVPFEQNLHELRLYLIQTLVNFYQHLTIPENTAFLRLVLEQSQRNSELALHIYEKGAQYIQTNIEQALQQAHDLGFLYCNQPQYSAKMYFGILRDLEWRILMGLPIPANNPQHDQEINKYITYCIDLFLDAHQKV